MGKLTQKIVRTFAALSQTAAGAMFAWMPVNAAERPRPVSEILNVSEAFVDGFPQKHQPTTQVRLVD
jgi:hypothetical protein